MSTLHKTTVIMGRAVIREYRGEVKFMIEAQTVSTLASRLEIAALAYPDYAGRG
jgi:hypothetical protein